MIISVASGKGGTGKTTVAVNLALSLNNKVQFLDCDVEEPNAHIFLKPEFKKTYFVSIPIPEVNKEKCSYCGKCSEICEYNAIAVLKNDILIFPELCTGCGGCTLLCPEKAISEREREIGIIEESIVGVPPASHLQFAYGKLNIGEARATPVIRELKNRIDSNKVTIIDAAPGTSCPVISAVKGSDFCILVTEPTPFGLNDLILAVEVLKKLSIPFGVVINKANIGNEDVTNYCTRERIPILMSIPFDKEIAMAYSNGIPIVEWKKDWKQKFQALYISICKLMQV